MHTIIGASPFHGPVRDGKAWFQRAIATRHFGGLRPAWHAACCRADRDAFWKKSGFGVLDLPLPEGRRRGVKASRL
jgi:hypothetical protein